MEETENTTSNPEAQAKPEPSRPKNKSIKWLVLAALILIILIGTPFAIQYGIQQALLKAGAQTVSLEDVDFNPFAGELVIKNLSAQTGEQPELLLPYLRVRIAWLPLFSKQLHIESVELQQMSLDVDQDSEGAVHVAGLLLPASEKPKEEQPKSEWGFGIDELILKENVINISTPDFNTHTKLTDVNLSQLVSWSPEQSADFKFQSALNGAPFSGNINLNLFSKTPNIQGKINIEQFDLADFIELAQGKIETLGASLSADIQFNLAMTPEGVEYKQSGSVSLHDLNLATADLQTEEQMLSYAGDLSFKQHDTRVLVDGQLSWKGLNLQLNQPGLAAQIDQGDWQGSVQFQQQEEQPTLTADGSFQSAAVSIRSAKDAFQIVSLKGLSIEQLNVQAIDHIQAQNILLDGLRVAATSTDAPSLLQTEKLTISEPEWGPDQDLNIAQITLSQTKSAIQFDKQGKLPLLEQLLASVKSEKTGETTPQSDANQSKDQPQPKIAIGGIALKDDTLINVTAETDADPIRKKIRLKTATIGRIDNTQPNAETPVKIDSVIDQHATLTSDGYIKPFASKTNLDLQTAIKALDLHDFSPIIKQHIGYNITSGQLNADSKLAIKDDVIDGKNKLTINQMKVASANTNATEKLNQQLAMPLDSALDLLRDGEGDIKLNVPLSGDINAPNFDLGDIINQAIGGALKGTTTNLLKLALQPYGLIFMAAEKALEASASISLEPIVFQPGSAELAGNASDYLEKISQLMSQRPGIRIRICGVATESDRTTLLKGADPKNRSEQDVAKDNEALIQMATDRADAVRGYMIEKHQISVERLFTCLPKLDKDPDTQPMVQLLI